MAVVSNQTNTKSKSKPQLVYELSTCFLINHQLFSKASAADQTAAIANSQGKPIVFNENIPALKNRRLLRDKILDGADVSIELELCEIELSGSEMRTLELARAVIQKIFVKPSYTWLETTEEQCKTFAARFSLNTSNIRLNGYDCTLTRAKNLWQQCSRYWGDSSSTADVTLPEANFDGYRRRPHLNEHYVEIGCQKMSRAEVEYIAKHYGWEPAE